MTKDWYDNLYPEDEDEERDQKTGWKLAWAILYNLQASLWWTLIALCIFYSWW